MAGWWLWGLSISSSAEGKNGQGARRKAAWGVGDNYRTKGREGGRSGVGFEGGRGEQGAEWGSMRAKKRAGRGAGGKSSRHDRLPDGHSTRRSGCSFQTEATR